MTTKNEFLAECLYQNVLKESNTSADIGKYAPLILPLVQKIYPESLVNQIASVQPTTSPLAKVAALYTIYTGDGSNNDNNIHLENSRIFTVPASADALFTIDSTGASGTNTFTVFYKETATEYTASYASGGDFISRSFPDAYVHILVRVDSGNFVTGSSILTGAGSGESLLYVSANRNIIKRVFSKYATVLEDNSDLKEVNFEIRTANVECKTRKIKSKFTQEHYQSIQSLYKEKAETFVAEYIANEIQQEIDREVIEYIKDIATPMPIDIQLKNSLPNEGSGSIGDMTYDLYFTIFSAIEEIVKATKRNRTMFILADSATVALLVSNALHSEVSHSESNPYRVGQIGSYPLFCDPYSTEHYMIIGYRYESEAKDDAGLIFTPYTSTVVETVNPDTFGKVFMTMNRYGYIRHPQDSGTAEGDSDFFRYVAVNFDGIVNNGANLTPQVRKSY